MNESEKEKAIEAKYEELKKTWKISQIDWIEVTIDEYKLIVKESLEICKKAIKNLKEEDPPIFYGVPETSYCMTLKTKRPFIADIQVSLNDLRILWVHEEEVKKLEAQYKDFLVTEMLGKAKKIIYDMENDCRVDHSFEQVIKIARKAWALEEEIQKLEDNYYELLPIEKLSFIRKTLDRIISNPLEEFDLEKMFIEAKEALEQRKSRNIWYDDFRIQKLENEIQELEDRYYKIFPTVKLKKAKIILDEAKKYENTSNQHPIDDSKILSELEIAKEVLEKRKARNHWVDETEIQKIEKEIQETENEYKRSFTTIQINNLKKVLHNIKKTKRDNWFFKLYLKKARKAWALETELEKIEEEYRNFLKQTKQEALEKEIENIKKNWLTIGISFAGKLEEAREAWVLETELEKMEEKYKKALPTARLKDIEKELTYMKENWLIFSFEEYSEKAREDWANETELKKLKEKYDKFLPDAILLNAKKSLNNLEIWEVDILGFKEKLEEARKAWALETEIQELQDKFDKALKELYFWERP